MALATQYREQGLNMLHEYAHYLEASGQKSVSVEAGLMDMLQRMELGRFGRFSRNITTGGRVQALPSHHDRYYGEQFGGIHTRQPSRIFRV